MSSGSGWRGSQTWSLLEFPGLEFPGPEFLRQGFLTQGFLTQGFLDTGSNWSEWTSASAGCFDDSVWALLRHAPVKI